MTKKDNEKNPKEPKSSIPIKFDKIWPVKKMDYSLWPPQNVRKQFKQLLKVKRSLVRVTR